MAFVVLLFLLYLCPRKLRSCTIFAFLSLNTASLAHEEIFGPKFSSFERAAVIVLVYSVLCCLWVLLCKITKLKKAPFSFKCTPFACH